MVGAPDGDDDRLRGRHAPNTSGRIVGVFVMLAGVAYLTVVIAVITASLIAREQREQQAAREAETVNGGDDALHARFDALEDRMGRMEAMLARSSDR